MTRALFAAADARWNEYAPHLRKAFDKAGLAVDLARDHPPETVDYLVYAPNSGLDDFRPFTRLKAILSLWAGVEDVVGNPTLNVPLARMVDPGLTEGMVEWVTGHVLRYHLGIDATLAAQDGSWHRHIPPLARHRKVGVLGLGELGEACAKSLAALNFDVAGWARRGKTIPGVTCHSGRQGLDDVLSRSEILVLLLPSTPATENLLNGATLARLPTGATILNPGRGTLIDDTALLSALDTGQIRHATLDVFREEPLPKDHRYWGHPNVTVTPHIASHTRAETASQAIAENIRRGEMGEPFLHLVDQTAGY